MTWMEWAAVAAVVLLFLLLLEIRSLRSEVRRLKEPLRDEGVDRLISKLEDIEAFLERHAPDEGGDEDPPIYNPRLRR